MRAFDDPVDLVVYMREKTRAIALLKTLENLSDVVFGDHEILLRKREHLHARNRTDCLASSIPAASLRASLIEFIEHFHEVADPKVFERTDGILDLLARFRCSMASRQLIEFRLDVLPCEWSGRESRIV